MGLTNLVESLTESSTMNEPNDISSPINPSMGFDTIIFTTLDTFVIAERITKSILNRWINGTIDLTVFNDNIMRVNLTSCQCLRVIRIEVEQEEKFELNCKCLSIERSGTKLR